MEDGGDVEFAVIIPTHNRPRQLQRCVTSVLAQSYARARYEILVVDDGSRPATRCALAPYITGAHLRYLRQPQQGWGAARQTGARASQAEILVFLDDDCTAPPHWLATYAEVYAAHPQVDGVAGGLRPGPGMNMAGQIQYRGHRAYFDHHNAPLDMHTEQAGRAWFTFGGNRSFRQAIWWAAQPERPLWYFDDHVIDLRLRDAGRYIYYEPRAWVDHDYRLGVGQRLRAAYRYGRSEVGLEAPVATAKTDADAARTLRQRWQRLRAICPDATWAARGWYALTQPATWLARWLGQRHARRSKP